MSLKDRRQELRADPATPARIDELFEPVPESRSGKVQCKVCGARGFPRSGGNPWQIPHLAGHAPCARGCGRMLTVLLDGSPRRHSRCPGQ